MTITYPPELLPLPEDGQEAEVIVSQPMKVVVTIEEPGKPVRTEIWNTKQETGGGYSLAPPEGTTISSDATYSFELRYEQSAN